jgi:hypothetical protein
MLWQTFMKQPRANRMSSELKPNAVAGADGAPRSSLSLESLRRGYRGVMSWLATAMIESPAVPAQAMYPVCLAPTRPVRRTPNEHALQPFLQAELEGDPVRPIQSNRRPVTTCPAKKQVSIARSARTDLTSAAFGQPFGKNGKGGESSKWRRSTIAC